ncbi:MAG: hypothetical protein C0614_11750 [Desulfuromonas sp.]|nr:MAG: hypothetical protein C0614_11750 [Desulfuromonas sp.]
MPDQANTSQSELTPLNHLSQIPKDSSAFRITKIWWAVAVCSVPLFYLLSNFNYLLYHGTVEMASIALATAVFLVAWNTRKLVESPALLILAIGLFCASLVDLMHTMAYKGMGVFPGDETNLSIQFWVVARILSAGGFFLAALSQTFRWEMRGWAWLASFWAALLVLVVAVWPLEVFPDCYIDGEGLTPFKVVSEYLVIVIMAASALLFWSCRLLLSPSLVRFLLVAILFNVLAEFSFTLYQDVYGFYNFLGHLLKLAAVVAVFAVLVRETLSDPYHTLFRELSLSKEKVERELDRRRRSEVEKEAVNRELALLYRVSRPLHSTMQLDSLSHLILSLATAAAGGGFRRAMFFTVNMRSQVLQGMLGVNRDASEQVLPRQQVGSEWDAPRLDQATLETQRFTEFNRAVVKVRLPLDTDDNPLAKCFFTCRPVVFPVAGAALSQFSKMVEDLRLGPSACTPLCGHKEILGVLVVETDGSEPFPPSRLQFLEMFARQAADSLENAQLLHRLEHAHDELRDVQERLIENEKLSVLGEMAAQVAHELKNPLVSIGGFAQRLTRIDSGNDKVHDYAAIIAKEVRRLEEMLGNILAFSKKQLICFEECNIAALVAEVIELEMENFRRQEIEIHVEAGTVSESMTGDCRQIRQVLHNLLINARQVMPRGGELFVRIYTSLLRGDQAVSIEIEDTGGGIPAEILRNIFNPFFSTRSKGAGLGLSISHRIVAHHHGEIEVVNSERGARFIVRLPVRPPAPVANH